MPGRENKKFDAPHHGPYKILEKVGKLAYKLDLPMHLNVHPVVSITQLLPARPPGTDEYNRQPKYQEPVTVEGDDISKWRDPFSHYEVERLVEKRLVKRGKQTRVEYLVKFQQWPSQYNTWYDAGALEADEMIEDFEKRTAVMNQLRDLIKERTNPRMAREHAAEPGEVQPKEKTAAESPKKRGRPRKSMDN